jgi:hypothetical protein
VDLDGSVEDDVLRGLISDFYDLVVAGLPRSIRGRPDRARYAVDASRRAHGWIAGLNEPVGSTSIGAQRRCWPKLPEHSG